MMPHARDISWLIRSFHQGAGFFLPARRIIYISMQHKAKIAFIFR